jgi:hypothetical protein
VPDPPVFSDQERSNTTVPPPAAAMAFKSVVDFDLTLFKNTVEPLPFAFTAIDLRSVVLNLLASKTMPPPAAAIAFKSVTDLFIVFFTIGYRPCGAQSRRVFSVVLPLTPLW